jgi:alcohol dehydrogenase
VPARKLPVSRRLAFDQLALVETLAIGCHAVARSGLRSAEWCLILSAGPIGLATPQFARPSGARVIVFDLNAARLDFCRRVMGAEHTPAPSERLEPEPRDLTGGHLPGVVIDATGHSGSVSAAFGLVAPAGRLVFVGVTAEEVRFRHPVFHRPGGTLLCSRNARPGDLTRIIGLIEQGRIDTRPWVTHRTAFDELIDAFPPDTRPETGVVKAVVTVGGQRPTRGFLVRAVASPTDHPTRTPRP